MTEDSIIITSLCEKIERLEKQVQTYDFALENVYQTCYPDVFKNIKEANGVERDVFRICSEAFEEYHPQCKRK